MKSRLFLECMDIGVKPKDFIPFGYDKGKLQLSVLTDLQSKGKLILVTSLTPTDAGEGKTTVSIGLSQALNLIEKQSSILSLREPSLGPTFGMKGGATGGGRSRVEPKNEIDLHFTGDIHAITAANNMVSALIDSHIFHGNVQDIKKVVWKRCIDINDRSLRRVDTTLRGDEFVITAASEMMAIMALATGLSDLRKRIDQILVGFNSNGQPVIFKSLEVVDAILAILVNALNPNVVLTSENTLALIHTGPFANIAHGCSSVVATKMALGLSKYTVTEAGFGADLGMEKFINIKKPLLDKDIDVVVLVVTIKAIREHGLGNLQHGLENVTKHIENIKKFNLNYIIALNSFVEDQKSDYQYLASWAKDNNHEFAISTCFIHGGKGSLELAKKVIQLSKNHLNNHNIFETDASITLKISTIAREIYGATEVVFLAKAQEKILIAQENHFDTLPVCIAKTPASLSGNSRLKGRPVDFKIFIDDINFSLGAGFVVALTKGIINLPGLNEFPRAKGIKVSIDGEITGL